MGSLYRISWKLPPRKLLPHGRRVGEEEKIEIGVASGKQIQYFI